MSATLDRQLRPIYGLSAAGCMLGVQLTHVPYFSFIDAIDTGSNKSAIVACNKLLKKQPKNDLIKVCMTCSANIYLRLQYALLSRL